MINKITREKEHYERVDRQKGYRVAQHKFYEGIAYAEIERCFSLMLGNVAGKTILSIGCGKGSELIKIAQRGADIIIGIDVSEHRVSEAASKIASYNLSNAKARTMNAECLEFQDSSFDIVIGQAILHHVHVEKCIQGVSRVLKEGGHAVFIEPLGMNPAINLYRKLTPWARSPNEHPLKLSDIKILERYFKSTHWEVFHLITLCSFLFRSKEILFKKIFNFFYKLDTFIAHKLNFMRRFYWIVCIKCTK